MADKIDTVSARARLALRREPYWQRLSTGAYVGYRKLSETSPGTWVARLTDAAGIERFTSLGKLEQFKPHERFDRAVQAAQKWINGPDAAFPLSAAPAPAPATAPCPATSYSTDSACQDYVERIRELRGDEAARDLDSRYARWVEPSAIATKPLTELTNDDLTAFRRALLNCPVIINKSGDTRPRSKDTVNRDMAALRAALNYALERGKVSTDSPWRSALKAYKNVSRRRTLYLDRDQRRELISSASADIARFLTALSILPLRPGALAALTVAQLDTRLNVLSIGRDKSGQDRRIKLPQPAVTLFSQEIDNQQPGTPLFARADGTAWNKDSWFEPIRVAARAAGLPSNVSAYTLRHSVITDLVVGNLDLLTVAQLSGTSVVMIEKHYGHLRQDIAAEALAKLIL